jgi:hypothetical protein
MKRLKSLFIALLLSSQLSFAGAFESFNVAVNEVHQVFSHNQAIEHHHHDAFETHIDHGSTDSTHQHVTDTFQSSALLPHTALFPIVMMVKVLIAPPPQAPPSVFLDGFLRPPRATV